MKRIKFEDSWLVSICLTEKKDDDDLECHVISESLARDTVERYYARFLGLLQARPEVVQSSVEIRSNIKDDWYLYNITYKVIGSDGVVEHKASFQAEPSTFDYKILEPGDDPGFKLDVST
jgi:hypothetical protein